MGLPGRIAYKTGPTGSGASGTIAVPAGAALIAIVAHSSGAASVTIFGGDTIPIINGAAPTVIPFPEDMYTTGGNVVFTGTDVAMVIYKVLGVQ